MVARTALDAEGCDEVVRVHEDVDDRVEQDREEHVAGVVETEDATDDDGDRAVVEEVEERHLRQHGRARAGER